MYNALTSQCWYSCCSLMLMCTLCGSWAVVVKRRE